MKAIDLLKARRQMYEFAACVDLPARMREKAGREAIEAAIVGVQQNTATFLAPVLRDTLIEQRPEHQAANYYVDAKLVPMIESIAEAMDPEMVESSIPAPTTAGFALLGEPLRWLDPWQHENTANLVVWGPGTRVVTPQGQQDYPFTAVGFWTNHRDQSFRYLQQHLSLEDRTAWNTMTRGWHLSRVAMRVDDVEVGPFAYPIDAEEREQISAPSLPVPESAVARNLNREVTALFAVLNGAHAPGSTHHVERVVSEPGKGDRSQARKSGAPAQVSFITAGVERKPTPAENVGSRGPIGVRYWREGYSKRVVLDDGSVITRKRRGTWCGDENNPLSPYTKVRIAKGTVARPSDFIPEEVKG